ncbi:Murein DD-endopeptidase MepM and murein hydrolase activator NlpD, contain LysM domain [Allosphingosinicella indica]|uniref:Murein DD-endopeptidase MepM and murein hydrolase activator NlpD, contain LysM domain n=2 Tax=Allosphingosinicella indica TaxID=941907 RepID=A0A1X7G302_9SPHN|nr:Murein DD-endopeptidase MepM and murein hydrolase activator NlpD, contain LysM domain [Allosphingosinicella indica]
MYQFGNMNGGPAAGAAALSLDHAIGRPRAPKGFGTRVSDLQDRSRDLEFVVDLGVRIGSREWLRGLATCTALCFAAWSFAPGLEPIAVASTPKLTDAQWEESRALAIAPLAFGGDTGRRMAPTDAVEPLTDTPERPSVDLLATLARGDGLARVLERSGVGAGEAQQIAGMISGVLPLTDIKPGTVLDVTLGRRPNRQVARPLDLLTFRARFDLKMAVERVDGRLAVRPIPIAVDDTPLRITGRIGSSLYRSARAAGAPAKAVEGYIRAVASQTGIDTLGADDRFDIILEHRRAATGETESGKLLYAGLSRSRGKNLQLMQWDQDGRTQWFEASGVGKTTGMLQRPVPGNVSSNFGMRRHPILGYSRMHKGMDFRAGYGTPILAASDGRVSGAGWHGGYGQQVRIDHGGGLATSYSHMSRIVARAGSQVRRGQVIGYVGSTGLSTGPHLHYEMYRNGAAINPASVKFTTRAQLAGADLARFRSQLKSLLAVPVGGRAQPVQQATAETPAKTANGA